MPSGLEDLGERNQRTSCLQILSYLHIDSWDLVDFQSCTSRRMMALFW